MTSAPQTTNRRVLVIDDTPSIHEDFRKILSGGPAPALGALEAELFEQPPAPAVALSFEMVSAYQGQEGLEAVRASVQAGNPFAVAFVDVRMPPGWDGIETIVHLWELDPELQIVICTAYSDYSWEQVSGRLRQPEQFLILKKPFDVIEVLQLAHTLSEKWRLARESRELLRSLEKRVQQRTQELSDQAAQLRLQSAALTAAENAVVITDLQAAILWHNPAFTRLTGYAPAEAIGRKMSLIKSGSHSREFYKQLWDTITSGRPWHGEIINRRKDAHLFHAEASITPVLDASGAITHYISIQRDISVRKRTEKRIQAFATLGKRLNIADTCREAAQIILEVGDQLLGWDACTFDLYSTEQDLLDHVFCADSIKGQRTECQPNLTHQPPTPMARRAIQEGGLLVLRENPQTMRPDGLPFGDLAKPSASILFVPIRNGKQVIGVLSIQSYTSNAYDQASLDTLQALADHCGGALDRIKAQENLRHTQEQLRQSQKLEAIGQLAGGVAHDFNNLLAVIRGNADLVLMNPERLGRQAGDCLRQITAASDRAANLTNQLLIFGRKQVMQSRRVELNELVRNLTKMLQRLIGEHIDLRCKYAAPGPSVHADRSMLEQVLVNLVVNARDAMPRGGRLSVSTNQSQIDSAQLSQNQDARTGLFATLSVEDSGTGIAAGILPRIFEPFFTTKDVGKGTGLGLSTVYGIVKQHQGWVEVSSRLGAGSTFTIFLPALTETGCEPDTGAASEVVLPGGSERILLVEDDDGVRELTRTVLEKFGYRVRQAASGGQVMEECSDCAHDFELLLTDMVMPGGISGREVAERLRAKNPALKVLFTSGYSGDTLGQDTAFLRRTHTRFLPKPCSSHQLLQAVRQSLDEPPPPRDSLT